jgi:hypothetical protein
VLAPKLLPWLVLPEQGSAALDRWTRLLPAATLGAFTALSASQWLAGRPAPGWSIVGLLVPLLLAVTLRRTVPALALGTVLVVALHVAGLA